MKGRIIPLKEEKENPMPTWLVALLEQLPALIEAINAIITGANGNPTPADKEQIAVYSATIHGINRALAYHVAGK